MNTGRKGLIVIGGISVYTITTYLSYQAYKIASQPDPHIGISDPSTQTCYSSVYDSISDYDSKIDWDEVLMGLPGKRRAYTSECRGSVLETSAGTGRNIGYYNSDLIKALHITDTSKPMLQTVLTRLRGMKDLAAKTEVRVMDSCSLLYPDKHFDSIIDTFGLCSCEDPVGSLIEMKRVLKDDGTIYLLQHGRCQYNWLNKYLDKTSERHAQHWGCWWNRDIISLILESGLRIDEVKKYHFGTTYMIKASK